MKRTYQINTPDKTFKLTFERGVLVDAPDFYYAYVSKQEDATNAISESYVPNWYVEKGAGVELLSTDNEQVNALVERLGLTFKSVSNLTDTELLETAIESDERVKREKAGNYTNNTPKAAQHGINDRRAVQSSSSSKRKEKEAKSEKERMEKARAKKVQPKITTLFDQQGGHWL